MNLIGVENYIWLSTLLFVIGMIGVMSRRNAIIMLMCIELMLNAANLAIIAFSRLWGSMDGHIFVFFTMLVAAAEVAIGLALIVHIYRKYKTTDISFLDSLNG